LYFAAQVFTVDPGLFAGATQAWISGVDLFFRAKPAADVNRSGIVNPGATVFLVSTQNGAPTGLAVDLAPHARVEYGSINVPNTAHHLPATRFEFASPIQVTVGDSYAFVVKFDANEDFDLWTDVKGWQIETDDGDTTQISGGVRSPKIGKLYAWGGLPPIQETVGSDAARILGEGDSVLLGFYTASQPFQSVGPGNWTELHDTALTFKVYAARWAAAGNTFTSNTANSIVTGEITTTNAGSIRIVLPSRRYEYCVVDHLTSGLSGLLMGERVYQNTVFYPGGTANTTKLSVVAGSNLVTYANGAAVNFSTLLNVAGADPEWLVITSEDHDGANADRVCVRQVSEVVSNTSVRVTEPVNFTNAAATFFRSPTAVLDQLVTGKVLGTLSSMAVLVDSTANSSIRFVNDSIITVSVNVAGNGYSNSDYVTFGGFENVTSKVLGGYPAKANVVTNANGAITGIYLSNVGCGFVNTSTITTSISNSTNQPSTGTNATFTVTTGSIVKTEHLGQSGSGGNLEGCKFIDQAVGEESPRLSVINPAGTFYVTSQRLPYYSLDDAAVLGGTVTYCDASGDWDEFQVKDFSITQPWQLTKRRVLPSWSNEWHIPYANGSACGAKGGSTTGNTQPLTSNSSVLLFDLGANNDFSAIQIRPGETAITYGKYIVNDSYAGEETNHGNAYAKGVEVKANLANGSFAEDIRVYATVHRPAGTDVKAYVRFYNSHDSDAFDDKDWTLLSCISGNGVFSGAQSPKDFIELTWGLPATPNTGNVLAGVVSTTLNSYNIVGSNTAWNSDLANGDVIVLRNGLFPDFYQVAVVNAITNSTFLSLYSPVANNDMVGNGFSVAKVSYPHQAFSNWLNENVVRYYSSSKVEFDTFDVFQVKLVMTSNSSTIVPYLDDARAIALSS
jgi:hypothetical protein